MSKRQESELLDRDIRKKLRIVGDLQGRMKSVSELWDGVKEKDQDHGGNMENRQYGHVVLNRTCIDYGREKMKSISRIHTFPASISTLGLWSSIPFWLDFPS